LTNLICSQKKHYLGEWKEASMKTKEALSNEMSLKKFLDNVYEKQRVQLMHFNIWFIFVFHFLPQFEIRTWWSLINTVKPVLRGHLWDKEKVALKDRWHVGRGDSIGRFDMLVEVTV
jgi:hypothetical protein